MRLKGNLDMEEDFQECSSPRLFGLLGKLDDIYFLNLNIFIEETVEEMVY